MLGGGRLGILMGMEFDVLEEKFVIQFRPHFNSNVLSNNHL